MNKKQTKPEQKPKQQTFAELYDECWAQITTESKPKNGYEVLKSKMPLLKKMFDQESKKVEAAQHEKLLTIADFENRRKHLETQAQADFKYRGFELASQIIASLDHMQQALTTTATSPEVTDFLTGFRMIHKKMLKDLEMVGVKPMMIKAGTRFDHSRHHAVEKKTSHKFKPNTVIEVKSPG